MDNPFPELEVTYDDGSRSLLVIPNGSLDPEREIHLILYREIEDEHGTHTSSRSRWRPNGTTMRSGCSPSAPPPGDRRFPAAR